MVFVTLSNMTEGEAEKTESPPADADSGDKPKAVDKVDRAEQAVKRMDEQLALMDEKIAELKKLETNRIFGGETEAGSKEEPVKQETNKEYRQRIEKEIAEGKHDN